MNEKYIKILLAATMMSVVSCASAASFQIQEQNAKDLGTAYAGSGSLAEDASTNWFNPAGLTEITNYNAAISAVYLKPKFELNVISARNQLNGAVTGAPGVTKSSKSAIIPGFHISAPINDKFSFGFSVVTPFGLQTEYSDASLVRFSGTRTKLQSIDFTPSIAYKVSDKLSFGLSWDYARTECWFDSRFAPNAGRGEGDVKVYGKGNSHSFHMGVLYKLSDNTKIGLTFHNQHSVHLKGQQLLTGGGLLIGPASSLAQSYSRLPSSINYSVSHQYDDKWAMLGDLQWTKWSVFKEIRIQRPNVADIITPLDYKNAWRAAFGVHYKKDDAWIFKGGIAYDKSPTNNQYRTVRIPDQDRVWLSMGAKYNFNNSFTLDGGYSYITFKKADIRDGPTGIAAPFVAQVRGDVKPRAHLVGVQLTWNLV